MNDLCKVTIRYVDNIICNTQTKWHAVPDFCLCTFSAGHKPFYHSLCSLMPFSLLNCFCHVSVSLPGIFSNLNLYYLIRVISSLFCFPTFSQFVIYLPRHIFMPLFLMPHSPGFAIQFFLLSFLHWNEMISCHTLLAGGLLGRVERQVLGHSFSHYSKILSLPATAALGWSVSALVEHVQPASLGISEGMEYSHSSSGGATCAA